jgi:tripartite-type tricarboxylate transporter receptor subunit TctC
MIPQAIVAPARTPPALINRLNAEIVRVLTRPDVKERHFSIAVETVGSSPEELAAAMRSDIVRWGRVIREAGIRLE